ncbi:MAG: phospholipase [Aquabacterium sp.]
MAASYKPLRVLAGPRARLRLCTHGLQPGDVRVVPAAAGGPKGLIFNALDRLLFANWLRDTPQSLHLMGASIGAWRMACATLPDADAALRQLAHDYVHQRYDHAPGRAPLASHVSERLGATLRARFEDRAGEVLSHPGRRLHVFTSHGQGLLGRQGRLRTPLGYGLAFGANLVSRRALGRTLRRVVFSDPRTPWPFVADDFPTDLVPLSATNLCASILASCSIPFWLDAVHDIPGGPAGAYWDGGITDYHLHLPYADMDQGLVLYPHFSDRLVPGWLDKALTSRHRPSPFLDNVVLLVPHPDWVASLPNGKLPDRADFKAYGDDHDGRVRVWSQVVSESERLADAFAGLTALTTIDAEPLI